MDRVAENVRALRRSAGVKQAELARRMTQLGVPTQLNTVSRIENGARVLDVLELLALSIALGVTPNRLLLTSGADPEAEIPLVPAGLPPTPVRAAWMWASGQTPLYEQDLPDGIPRVDHVDFGEENRPHNPPNRTMVAEYEMYRRSLDQIQPYIEQVRRGASRGAPPIPNRVLAAYLTQLAFVLESLALPETSIDTSEIREWIGDDADSEEEPG